MGAPDGPLRALFGGLRRILCIAYTWTECIRVPLRNRYLDAIELYRKANHNMEAAKLLMDLAKESADKKVGVACMCV